MKKISLILIVWCICLQCLSAQNDTPKQRKAVEVEQIVENWSYPHYQNDVLLWEAKGKKVRIVGESEVKAEGFEIRYHYRPAGRPADQAGTPEKKEIITIRANKGSISKKEQKAVFQDNVIIKDEQGTELITQELSSNLKEKLVTTNQPVTITRPGIKINGTGLDGELTLRKFILSRTVRVTIKGKNLSSFSLRPSEPLPADDKPISPSDGALAATEEIIITCDGPMIAERIYRPGEPGNQKITFKNQVRFVKSRNGVKEIKSSSNDVEGEAICRLLELTSSELEIILTSQTNPDTGVEESVVSHLFAAGDVKISDGLNRTECHTTWWDEPAKKGVFNGSPTRLVTFVRYPSATAGNHPITLLAQTILTRPEQDIFVLKGKKQVIFFISQDGVPIPSNPQENTGNNPTTDPLRRGGDEAIKADLPAEEAGKIYITSHGNAVIYLKQQKAYFKDKVRVTQRDDATNGGLKSIMKCGYLVLYLDAENNEIKKARARDNILLLSQGGNKASGDVFEWLPTEHRIDFKANFAVKVWHQNSLIEADQIIIHTKADRIGQIGQWEKIEARNKNGSEGTIKIARPQKEEKEKE